MLLLVFAKTAGGVGKISTTNQPGSQQGLRCCSWATYQEANRAVQPLSDCNSITESVGNLSQERITANPQSSTVKHSIQQLNLLAWTDLHSTSLFCNHSSLACSVCLLVQLQLREFSLKVA